MRATVQNDRSERVITVEVSGAPYLDVTENWHHKDRTIRPDYVEIILVDGEFSRFIASGPLLKGNGEPGRVRATWKCAASGARFERHTLDKAPEWVQLLVREAPAGVTSWGQRAEVPA